MALYSFQRKADSHFKYIDRIGRVPVIVLGAAWTSGLTLLFGLSDTLYGVLLNRLAGER